MEKAMLAPESKAMPKATENPVMARTSSIEAAAMTRVGMPVQCRWEENVNERGILDRVGMPAELIRLQFTINDIKQ